MRKRGLRPASEPSSNQVSEAAAGMDIDGGKELRSSLSSLKIKRKKKSRKVRRREGSSGPDAKRVRADHGNGGGRVDKEDKISQLPEHIIHQILSGLRNPKDLVRASVFSKRWREFCSSFPVLHLDQRMVEKKEEEEKKGSSSKRPYQKTEAESQEFKGVVDRALLNCQEREFPIDKLVMHMTSSESGLLDSADKLLSFVAGNKIRELDLHFPINNKSNEVNKRCYLPHSVLHSPSLTSLRLYGCKLGDCKDISLPSLRKLCLGKLYVTDSDMKNLIKRCPSVEDLRVIYCTGLTRLRVTGLAKLYKLEAHYCRELIQVHVLAPTLQTFCYHRKKISFRKKPCNIDLSACSRLRALKLEEAFMKDDVFQNMLDKFPLLEVLELTDCHSFKRIMIGGAAMKRLAVRGCINLEDASIFPPNLRSFEFKANTKLSLSLEPQSLKEAKLIFKTRKEGMNLSFPTDADLSWFSKLRETLGRFTQNNGMKLVVQANKKNVIIHEDLTEIILPPLADVEIEVVKASKGFDDILDSVLHSWHPETISIVSSTDSPLLKSMVGIMNRSREQPRCCAYNVKSNKCWRHFLKDAKIEELAVAEDAKQSSWISYLKSSPTTLKTTTLFRLSWLSRRKGATS